MVKDHPVFYPPSVPNQKIWRYMDFTKLVDLLNSSSLYFARSDTFDDIFEGSITKKTAEIRNKHFENLIAENKVKPMYTPEFWQINGTESKLKYAINCWHMNDFESAAMWKLYLKSNEGIAIQSSFDSLVNSLNDSKVITHIGTVNYADYENDFISWGNGFVAYLHKRKSFEHEKELRAIIWEPEGENKGIVDLNQGGVKVEVNLNKLIHNIYVSPDSPLWLTLLIKDTCEKFGYNFNIINSSLEENPVF